MANALDSAYEWGISRDNAKNLSQQQLLGLQSLRPSAGIGLGVNAPEAALNPYSKLPTPKFNPAAAGSFDFNGGAGLRLDDPTNFPKPTADVQSEGKPYYDPNYPYESMLALKNWLTPQVQAGVGAGENARGTGYSGLGKYGAESATNYLSQLAPMGEDGRQAMANDFNFLYGPNITNSLIEGSPEYKPSLPGAAEFAGGGTSSNASFIANKGNDGPLFGLVNSAEGPTHGSNETPGYWYSPDAPPDTSKMPWLEQSTPFSPPKPTQYRTNV